MQSSFQPDLRDTNLSTLPCWPRARLAAVAAACALISGLGVAPALAQTAEPVFELQPTMLQADPDTAPTPAYDFTVPNWYARGAVLILFPQEVEIGTAGDFTLGWGGGFNFAGGYSFNAGGDVSPRVEVEYILLLDEFRNLGTDDGITWNSLGVNGLVDFRVRDGMKLYAGAGAGMTYVSVDAGNTSDDAFTPYFQVLGGGLFRFSDDIEIDIGLRYNIASPELLDGDFDLANVLFHVGLLLRLE